MIMEIIVICKINIDKSDEKSSEIDKESFSSVSKNDGKVFLMENIQNSTIKNLFFNNLKKEQENFNDLLQKLKEISKSKSKPQIYKDKLIGINKLDLYCISFLL